MRNSLALRVSFGFISSLTVACGSAPADQEERSSTVPEVRAATRRVTLTTFPNAICRVHGVGSAEAVEVSADDAGEVSFTFLPDGAAEPALEADCRTGEQSRTIPIDLARAPLVPTRSSLERQGLLDAPEHQVQDELREPRGAPPVTKIRAINAGTYSDWFVGWEMPALGVPFMATTTTFRIPVTYGITGDTTIAGIFTGLSATANLDAAAFLSVVYTWIPFIGAFGQYRADCAVRGSIVKNVSITMREGDQFRLDAWFGTSDGTIRWDGNNAFCEFYNITANKKVRVGPYGLGGINTVATTALHGIAKSRDGSSYAPLTAWDDHLTMDAVALRATHGRFNPATSTAESSAIFSTESETYFDAVTRRSNGQLRFIWNWYY
jgi:hypothetical protein